MSSVFAIIFLVIITAAIAVVAYILRPKPAPAQMIESYCCDSDSEEENIEMYVPSCDTQGGCDSGEGCCGCDRLSSDLTFYCGGSGRSLCRYPIDLPAPEEPHAPSICKLSGACGESTCMDTLKFDLQ